LVVVVVLVAIWRRLSDGPFLKHIMQMWCRWRARASGRQMNPL